MVTLYSGWFQPWDKVCNLDQDCFIGWPLVILKKINQWKNFNVSTFHQWNLHNVLPSLKTALVVPGAVVGNHRSKHSGFEPIFLPAVILSIHKINNRSPLIVFVHHIIHIFLPSKIKIYQNEFAYFSGFALLKD